MSSDFAGIVKGGRFVPDLRAAWVVWFGAREGQRVVLTAAPWKRRRSLKQNAYFHGPVLAIISQWSGMSVAECKHWIKSRFLAVTRVLPDGREVETVRDTRDLTTVEWEDLMLRLRADFAAYCYIPLPNGPAEQEGDA